MNSKILDNTLRTKTLRGVGWMTLSTISKLSMQLIFMAVLARLLGPEVYGVLAIAMVLISFAQLISDGGLGKAIIHKQKSSDSQLSTVFYTSIAIGCCISLLISFFSSAISDFFGHDSLKDVLKVLSVVFIIRGFTVVAESLAFKQMNFKPIAIRDFLSYFISYAFISIPLAYLGWEVWALVFATVSQELIKAILILNFMPHSKQIRLFNIDEIKSLFKFAGGLTLSGVFNKIATNVDTLIVGKFLTINLLGIYSRGYKLMQLPAGLFGTVISATLFPALSSIKSDVGRTKDVHFKLIALTATIILPFSILMYSVSYEVVSILLGDKWHEVGPVLQVLALGIYFRIAYKINGEIIKSSGKVFQLTLAQIIYAFAVALGCYIGQFYGIYGVAYGVLAALGVHFFIMLYIGSKHTKLSLYNILLAHILPILMSVCLYFILYYIQGFNFYLHSNNFLRVLMSSCFFVSILFVYLYFCKDKDEVSWLISIVKKS